MLNVLKPERLMEDLLASYEQRIDGMNAVFDATRHFIADFQEGVRQEEEQVNGQLQEALARTEHLRKKDYDHMLQRIVPSRQERDAEIRRLLNEYLAEQQRLAADLKALYGQIRQQLADGHASQITGLLKAIKDLLAEQDQRKNDLIASLKEVQAEHREMVSMAQALLVKGNTLRIRDFKDMLARIQRQRRERIARKLARREEVRRMLAAFKQQRSKDSPLPPRAPSPPKPSLGGLQEALEALQFRQPQQGGTTTNETNGRTAETSVQVQAVWNNQP